MFRLRTIVVLALVAATAVLIAAASRGAPAKASVSADRPAFSAGELLQGLLFADGPAAKKALYSGQYLGAAAARNKVGGAAHVRFVRALLRSAPSRQWAGWAADMQSGNPIQVDAALKWLGNTATRLLYPDAQARAAFKKKMDRLVVRPDFDQSVYNKARQELAPNVLPNVASGPIPSGSTSGVGAYQTQTDFEFTFNIVTSYNYAGQAASAFDILFLFFFIVLFLEFPSNPGSDADYLRTNYVAKLTKSLAR